MLLTLTASCLRPLLQPDASGRRTLTLQELPEFTRQELGLHGLNLCTDLLAGIDRAGLERLREAADKAACACLVLIETEPQAFGDADPARAEAAVDRAHRVIQAAHVLGCSAVSIPCAGPDEPKVFERTAERLKRAVGRAERIEMNLLISPREGLTQTPERITELIKKVGGFRVGTHPDFQAAAAAPDPVAYLRRLTPYAGLVCASTVEFEAAPPEKPRRRRAKASRRGAAADEPAPEADEVAPEEPPEPPLPHRPYDLAPLVRAVVSVGYDGTLALDYRGEGDPRLGVERTRRAIEAVLRTEQRD